MAVDKFRLVPDHRKYGKNDNLTSRAARRRVA
jgi:hypothetical protein